MVLQLTQYNSDVLPSINHLDLDKMKTDRPDQPKYGVMNGLNISTAPLPSPNTIYSGPPPPYTYSSSVGSAPGMPGYISPPESTTRRSTKDEKESPVRNSLPSIQEALGAPLSAQHPPGSTPSTAITQHFPEAPRGPSNPFSQPPPTFRDSSFPGQAPPASNSTLEMPPKPAAPMGFPQQPSPRSAGQSAFHSSQLLGSSFSNTVEAPRPRSPPPAPAEAPRQPYAFSSLDSRNGYSNEPYQFTAGSKLPDARSGLPRAQEPYGDTVKRHLEVFDAELGLNEVCSLIVCN
jgi:hypothetical protein